MGMSGTALGLTTSDGRRPRVALVGGSPASVLVAGVLIEQFGCSPTTVPSATAALDLLKRDDGIDLMVADLAMGDMDGMCLVEHVRALGPRGALPIVALAGQPRHSRRPARPRRRLRHHRGQALQPTRALRCAAPGPGRPGESRRPNRVNMP